MSGRSQSIQLEFLKQVQESLRTEIAGRLDQRVKEADKGRSLLEKGSHSTDVFFLLEGRAQVVLYATSGRKVCVNDIGPGDMFGEIAVLTREPRSASVVALSEVQYAEMSEMDFMACLESSPAAGIWLASRFASSVRRLTEQVFELSALNVQTRIRCHLLRLADKGERCSEGIVYRPAPTHQEFADHIGTSREAVSREFNWLSDQGVIRYDRESLTIIDLARLERETRR